MSSGRWERVQLLFEGALAQSPECRKSFLEAACAGEIDLYEEVLSLLSAHDRGAAMESIPTVWLTPLARPKAARFSPGDRLAGRYRIARLLGRGGMGEVYEAWDDELSIQVALKTLHFASKSRDAFRSLKLEGMLARSVWHPNVCRVYDVGRHAKARATVWFLCMELLTGETLADRLQKMSKLPLDQALPLADQMAAGLGAAHRAGVVHRDFKPGNVMLVTQDGEERAVVTDFGTAQVPSRERRKPGRGLTSRIGTPAYMSPEQVKGDEVSASTDIYALGVVLFEMVTGELPFTGGSTSEVAKRRLVEDPPSPRALVPDLDERWETVIRRAMAREPSARFRRIEEIADALAARTPIEVEGAPYRIAGHHTLPAEQDPFFGRADELVQLKRQLDGDSRVVTLVGPGGMGKTRLAVHHALRTLHDWSGGVWFCDLTQARSVNGMASALARSLRVQLGRGDPLEHLGQAIAGRGRCLVILDNFEQVVDHAAETVGRWLQQAPEACFLVTSRERLDVVGESLLGLEALSIEAGIELFVARMRDLRPGSVLDDANAQAIREIVQLVEGMPLAIELAAARTRIMSATQVLARMRNPFQLLAGGRSAHHEKLESTIQGSWELLNPWEQASWAQCAVFEGGFTLDAAEAVLDLSAFPQAPWIVDVVQSLVDKSLLRTQAPADGSEAGPVEARFGMYVSLQEYARMKLHADSASSPVGGRLAAEPAAERRHGEWCARYGTTEAIEALDRRGGIKLRRGLDRELPNLLSACRRALRRGDGSIAVGAYRAAAEVLAVRGPFATAVELGREVLRGTELERTDRALLLWALARAERLAGRTNEALAFSEEALALARDAGSRRLEGLLTGWLGVLTHDLGKREESRALYLAGLGVHREVGDRRAEGVALTNLGVLFYIEGKLDEAQAHYRKSLAIHRQMGDRVYEGIVLSFLAVLHRARGRLDDALTGNEAALAIFRELGNRMRESQVLTNMANAQVELKRFDEARSNYEAALAIAREVGDIRNEGLFLGNLGNLHYEQGRMTEARTCYERSIAIHTKVGTPQMEATFRGSLARLLHREGEIEQAREALVAAEAILRQVDSLELAKLLCTRAELEFATGNLAVGNAFFAEAHTLAVQCGLGPDTEVGRLLAILREAHGASSLSTGTT